VAEGAEEGNGGQGRSLRERWTDDPKDGWRQGAKEERGVKKMRYYLDRSDAFVEGAVHKHRAARHVRSGPRPISAA
jgi:hypothetical protein